MSDPAASASPVSAPPSNARADTTPVRTGHHRPAPTAWVAPEGLDRAGWVTAGARLGGLSRTSNWWIGDWIRYGTAKWGEKYAAAAKITGYDRHSLENMAYVASRFDDISLRRENLSWSHHLLVAALEPDEQACWLDMATERRMSVNDLRIELRAAHRSLKAAPDTVECSTGSEGTTSTIVCPQCGFELPTESDRALSSPRLMSSAASQTRL